MKNCSLFSLKEGRPVSKNSGFFVCDDDLGLCCPEEPASFYHPEAGSRPLEIYMFIDPLCPECWALEPIIKKLQMEYSPYFTIRTILANEIKTLNQPTGARREKYLKNMERLFDKTALLTGMPCNCHSWFKNNPHTPYAVSIAIKAAELQGNAIGSKYLRRLRETLFLTEKNISLTEAIVECAKHVKGMDVEEFQADLHSESAKRAFQSDVKATKEMDVNTVPTLVFFNDNVNEPGLKVSGLYDYSVYVNIMEDMLERSLEKCPPMSLESFLKFYTVVASKEISIVFDLTVEEVEREMKKLQIQQKVKNIPMKFGNLWSYID